LKWHKWGNRRQRRNQTPHVGPKAGGWAKTEYGRPATSTKRETTTQTGKSRKPTKTPPEPSEPNTNRLLHHSQKAKTCPPHITQTDPREQKKKPKNTKSTKTHPELKAKARPKPQGNNSSKQRDTKSSIDQNAPNVTNAGPPTSLGQSSSMGGPFHRRLYYINV